MVVEVSHSRRGLLGFVPQSSPNFVCRWHLGLPAEAVQEGLPGHRGLLGDEANTSGARGEMIRAVSIWDSF